MPSVPAGSAAEVQRSGMTHVTASARVPDQTNSAMSDQNNLHARSALAALPTFARARRTTAPLPFDDIPRQETKRGVGAHGADGGMSVITPEVDDAGACASSRRVGHNAVASAWAMLPSAATMRRPTRRAMRQLVDAMLCAALVSAIPVGATQAYSLRVCDAIGLPEGQWMRWTIGDTWAAQESGDGKSSQCGAATTATMRDPRCSGQHPPASSIKRPPQPEPPLLPMSHTTAKKIRA